MNGGSALYLGVDGGGTGCRARLETATGTLLGQGIAGPASTRFGIDASWAAIESAFAKALSEAGLSLDALPPIHAGIGVAGYNRRGAAEALAALSHPFRSVAFTTDAMIACLGAHGGADGAIVIVGTGSCGIGLVEGREIQIGGYGFPISDEGSGADLGLRAIRQALRAHDGRQDATPLTREILERLGADPVAVIAWMDQATATDYATLAPLVLRHAENGDPVGRRVVQPAAEQLNGIVRTLIAAGAPRISLIGGLSTILAAWLAPDVRRHLKEPLSDSVAGAIALAKSRSARS